MNEARLEEIINAVLYEGYILYPYRASSKKNQRERFTFGRVYPEAYSFAQNGAEPCMMQTECLVETSAKAARLRVSTRFLQPIARETHPTTAKGEGNPNDALNANPAGAGLPWLEAVERRVEAPEVAFDLQNQAVHRMPFHFTSQRNLDVTSVACREATLEGTLEITVQNMEGQVPSQEREECCLRLFKITARILNQTTVPKAALADHEAVLLRTFASTHTVLRVEGGAFISLLDPASEYQQAARSCKNIGTWPVLVGEADRRERDTMLSSPIILYDYPEIAPESAGPLFDSTEIDELLTLRILTLTDQEKLQMRRVDAHARRLLERTESLDREALLNMHSSMRSPQDKPPVDFDDFFGANTRLAGVSVGRVYIKPGDRVRLRPKARADVLDMALSGQTAVVEAVEEDLEHRVHLAVVLENDPGKDLGMLRQPGHRFFYGVDEVQPLVEETR